MDVQPQPLRLAAGRRSLFAVFHPAPRPRAGVLLLPPLLQEHALSYRLFVVLADELARHGIAMLRPHYYGTGDSDGDGREFSLAQADADAPVALAALRERVGAVPVAVLGVRAGAFVAAALAARARLAALWLWRPVLDGAAYLAELHRIDAAERSAQRHAPEGGRERVARPHETLVGFCCGAQLLADLARAQLHPDAPDWPPLTLLERRQEQPPLPPPRHRIELTPALTTWEGQLTIQSFPPAAVRDVAARLAATLEVA